MRPRRRKRGLREIGSVVPNARSASVRRRIAAQVAPLDPRDEREVLDWIEAVSEFDDGPLNRTPLPYSAAFFAASGFQRSTG